MIGREVNAAIPVTLFLLISVTLYGFYDNLSGVDEGSDLDLIDPVMTHSVGLSIKDQSPVLPMIEALREAVQSAL